MLNADTREFEFTSDFDGLTVSALIAKPSGNINGIVQIVHGMNEHKERYFDFMDYLAEEGFITVIHDSRGHGKSICAPEDLGFMFRNGGQGFVEDIAQLMKTVRSAYPTYPYFIIGHSMGSLGVRCVLKEHDSELNGAIILGCPCYSRFSPFVRSINSAVAHRLGSRYRSEKIYEVSEKTLNKGFGSVPHSWLSSDKEAVEKFNSDPLCSFKYTLNGYEGLLYLMKETYSKKGWQVRNPRLPIRFISGRDDPCMISEKKFFKAIQLLDKVGYESVSHRLFDGMRHEVLNEKNNISVYKDIAKTLYSWIDRLSEPVAEIELPETAAPEEAAKEAIEALQMPDMPVSAEEAQETEKNAHASEADVFEILEAVQTAEEDSALKEE